MEPSMTININRSGLQLVFSGCFLFLIGLLQGGIVAEFTNSRMALSAHLAAVQSGMALMIFGTIWCLVRLGPLNERIARLSGIIGMYLVWLAITMAAVNGASRALPIAGSGYQGSQIDELYVSVAVYLGAGLAIVAVTLIAIGLYRNMQELA